MNYEKEWKTHGWRTLYMQAIATMCNHRHADMGMIDRYLDTDCIDLQQFAVEHATYQWMTGISILDAAHDLVQQAYENANIDEFGCEVFK